MSSQSGGPGWWQASDGNWYPPEAHPPDQLSPAKTPMPAGGKWIGGTLGFFVLMLGTCIGLASSDTTDEVTVRNASEGRRVEDDLPRATTTVAESEATSTTARPTTTTAAPTTTVAPTTAPPTTMAPTTTARPTTTAAPTTTTAMPVVATTATPTHCTPGYSPCIPPGDDVDCEGGGGNGPRYVRGPVQVDHQHGDPYDLDGNDNDGVGCES